MSIARTNKLPTILKALKTRRKRPDPSGLVVFDASLAEPVDAHDLQAEAPAAEGRDGGEYAILPGGPTFRPAGCNTV